MHLKIVMDRWTDGLREGPSDGDTILQRRVDYSEKTLLCKSARFTYWRSKSFVQISYDFLVIAPGRQRHLPIPSGLITKNTKTSKQKGILKGKIDFTFNYLPLKSKTLIGLSIMTSLNCWNDFLPFYVKTSGKKVKRHRNEFSGRDRSETFKSKTGAL